METRILSKTEQDVFGATHLFKLDYSDVAALGAATDGAAIALLTDLPEGSLVECVGMKLVTTFDCSGTGNLTLSIGRSGAETAFLAATQVAVDSTEILYSAGSGTQYATVNDTTDINAYFDSTGVNLDTYTSGEVAVYLRVVNLNRLPLN